MQLRAYRNEKMNQIRALIIIRRNIATATTQITINVTFERRNELELGKMSKRKKRIKKNDMNICFFLIQVFFLLLLLHRLYID